MFVVLLRRYSAIEDKADWPVSVHVTSGWSREPVSTAAECCCQ